MYRIEEVHNGRTVKVHCVYSNKDSADQEYSNLIQKFRFPDGFATDLSEINLLKNGKVIHSTKVITP